MHVERTEAPGRPFLPATLESRLYSWLMTATGLVLVAMAVGGWITLMSWSASDPSLTHATSGTTRNLLGPVGSILSDLALQTLGFSAVVLFLGPAWCGIELILNHGLKSAKSRSALFIAALVVLAGALSSIPAPTEWPLRHGLGGAIGDLMFNLTAGLAGKALPAPGAIAGLLLFAGGMTLLSASFGVGQREVLILAQSHRFATSRTPVTAAEGGHFTHDDMNEDTGPGLDPLPRGPAFFDRPPGHVQRPSSPMPAARERETQLSLNIDPAMPRSDRGRAAIDRPAGFDQTTDLASSSIAARFAPRQDSPAKGGEPGQRSPSQILGGLMSFRGAAAEWRRPSLNILKRPPAHKPGAEHTQPVLRGSARLLEDVLSDFGIKGEVKGVKPGPVVTLFEMEPQRGIKASRIVALSDDIARSMSATSARVAAIPGRNVMGIELPNLRRETVYLRELLEHETWRTSEAQLPVVLGKGIGGEPIVADLARMPHLLVAGTTGSGKSVGINALILSLIFKLSPAECRLLMIDPKMLELSAYNGIPHLLAPVVTDPHRAAAALGWAVSEMEERYKRMAELGVRNIEMFNVRVKNAKKRGELIGRTVQTGFDPKTGEAIYERADKTPEPMPYIVIVVDEFADLMAVAGKEVEGTVQRLAQMARAAGIHLVMATQRPSVDVVTGTIKANFPSRIAFRVASKVDSRTIINEQGAEQLLGAGDMLYSAGSGQILRVHGPFVSDEEVEAVAAALREQGSPAYVDMLIREPAVEADPDNAAIATPSTADDLFDRAVALVHRDGKVSTSYLQRRLGIGYNRAADLIERMEQEGLISPPDSAGRRHILSGGETN